MLGGKEGAREGWTSHLSKQLAVLAPLDWKVCQGMKHHQIHCPRCSNDLRCSLCVAADPEHACRCVRGVRLCRLSMQGLEHLL